jgi:hypothetical protein
MLRRLHMACGHRLAFWVPRLDPFASRSKQQCFRCRASARRSCALFVVCVATMVLLPQEPVAKSAHEHLVIFRNGPQSPQIWQWVKREPGKPLACREYAFHEQQCGDALLARGRAQQDCRCLRRTGPAR